VKRISLLVPVLLGISFVVFLLIHLIPGNPAATMLGTSATPAQIARLDHALGLDQPIWQQFLDYLGRVLQGNLGQSISQYQSVSSLIAYALPNTIELAVVALAIAVGLALPLGVASAVWRNSFFDFASMTFAQIGISMPVFWLGTLFVEFFALDLHLFPTFGIGPPVGTALASLVTGNVGPLGSLLAHVALPALTLGLTGAAIVSRMVRTAMIEVLGQDYIRTARAKGLSSGRIVWRHALSNALLVVVTVIGLQFGYFLGGAVIIESIFAWPGIGRLTVNAILARDFPLVQGCVLVIAALFAVVNLLVDVSYALLNPKIRYQ
jgi:peptide/nickel transport system permease protein